MVYKTKFTHTKMLSKNLRIKAFEIQSYNATKKLFRAVALGKSIVLYGPSGSGKTTIINENERLLKDYSPVYMDMQSKKQMKDLLNREGLFIVEGIYTGHTKLNLPRDDIECIHLAITLGERTNELSYE